MDNQTECSKAHLQKPSAQKCFIYPESRQPEGMGKPVSMDREVIHANQLESSFKMKDIA